MEMQSTRTIPLHAPEEPKHTCLISFPLSLLNLTPKRLLHISSLLCLLMNESQNIFARTHLNVLVEQLHGSEMLDVIYYCVVSLIPFNCIHTTVRNPTYLWLHGFSGARTAGVNKKKSTSMCNQVCNIILSCPLQGSFKCLMDSSRRRVWFSC